MTDREPPFTDYFCIGGPLDGAMYRSDKPYFYARGPVPMVSLYDPPKDTEEFKIPLFRYSSFPMYLGDEKVHFAFLDGLTPQDAIQMLMASHSKVAIERSQRQEPRRKREQCCAGICDGACGR